MGDFYGPSYSASDVRRRRQKELAVGLAVGTGMIASIPDALEAARLKAQGEAEHVEDRAGKKADSERVLAEKESDRLARAQAAADQNEERKAARVERSQARRDALDVAKQKAAATEAEAVAGADASRADAIRNAFGKVSKELAVEDAKANDPLTQSIIRKNNAQASKMERAGAAKAASGPTELQQLVMEGKRADIADKKARADDRNNKMKDAAAKDVERVQVADTYLKRIDGIIEKKRAAMADADPRRGMMFQTGANITPSIELLKRMPGVDLDERNAWLSDVQDMFSEKLKERSGAAVTASEETRAQASLLNANMDDDTFMRVAARVRALYAADIEKARARLSRESRAQFAQENPKGAVNANPSELDTDGDATRDAGPESAEPVAEHAAEALDDEAAAKKRRQKLVDDF